MFDKFGVYNKLKPLGEMSSSGFVFLYNIKQKAPLIRCFDFMPYRIAEDC